jgi:hypothetical protein
MTFITPDDEVKYTIQGLVPPAKRGDALLVDVGSGNTKGGFLKGDKTVSFAVPFGSVTFENRVTKDTPKDDLKAFGDAAAKISVEELAPAMSAQAAGSPDLLAKNTIILSGGAPYALATLLKPKDKAGRVELTKADIEAYAALVHKDPIASPDLEEVAGKPEGAEVGKVFDTFTKTNLISGAELLNAAATALKFEGKKLFFDRNGIMALIHGKVLEQLEKDQQVKTVPDDQRADDNGKTNGTGAGRLEEAKQVLPAVPPKSLPEAVPPVAPPKA